MTSGPLVSVLMAVKNGARFLRAALDSVQAQTYDHVEVVVVDGASTDDSVAVATSYDGVRCLPQRGTGFAGAWNEAVDASSGDVVTFLDSDDLWLPTKLERQLELLSGTTRTYVVARTRFVLEPGAGIPPGFRPELLDGDQIGLFPSALMISRADFDVVGPFDTGYGIASDIDWFARAKDLGLTLAEVDEELVHRRVHDANLSYVDAGGLNHQLLRLLRGSVHRQGRPQE